MKSLVLKDLFNIGHNAKSMLFILVVFAVALIPFSGVWNSKALAVFTLKMTGAFALGSKKISSIL